MPGCVLVPVPWIVVGLLPLAGAVISWLDTEAVAASGQGLPMEDVVSRTCTVACPCMTTVEANCAACVCALPGDVGERLVSMVCEVSALGDVPAVDSDGLGVLVSEAGPCVAESAFSAPDPALVTPGVDEEAEDASAMGGWDVMSKSIPVVPLALLCSGVGVVGGDPSL